MPANIAKVQQKLDDSLQFIEGIKQVLRSAGTPEGLGNREAIEAAIILATAHEQNVSHLDLYGDDSGAHKFFGNIEESRRKAMQKMIELLLNYENSGYLDKDPVMIFQDSNGSMDDFMEALDIAATKRAFAALSTVWELLKNEPWQLGKSFLV